MHASLSPVVLGLATFALAVAGCREAGETPVAPTGPPPAPAITPALVIGCMAPFTPTTTRADLAAAFGEGNVRQEAVAGPEGMRVNVTAIYPGDPSRRAEVRSEPASEPLPGSVRQKAPISSPEARRGR